MKKTMFNYAITMFIATAAIVSCKSPEDKVADAQASVVDAKKDLKEVQHDSIVAAAKSATADEWKMFKNDAEATIKNNEIRIQDLKAKMKKADKATTDMYAQKLETYEQQNQALKTKIADYDKNHSDWETFKKEFNKSVNDLGQSLKDFTIKDK